MRGFYVANFVLYLQIKECQSTFIQILFQFAMSQVAHLFASMLYEHTNVLSLCPQPSIDIES